MLVCLKSSYSSQMFFSTWEDIFGEMNLIAFKFSNVFFCCLSPALCPIQCIFHLRHYCFVSRSLTLVFTSSMPVLNFLNTQNTVTVIVFVSFSANLTPVSVLDQFQFIEYSHYRSLFSSCLVIFYWMWGIVILLFWMLDILYSYKSSWALFWVIIKLLENSLILLVFIIFLGFVRQVQGSSQSRVNYSPLLR